jgi:hypothetical protein
VRKPSRKKAPATKPAAAKGPRKGKVPSRIAKPPKKKTTKAASSGTPEKKTASAPPSTRTTIKRAGKKTPPSPPSPMKPSTPRAKARKPAHRRTVQPDTTLLVERERDDLYALRLLEELDFRHGIDISTIDIAVRGGQARARGAVSDEDELEAIRDSLSEDGGITDLDFFVQIAPTRREEDRDRARAIQEILDAESDLEPETIHVACLQNKVVLRGTVRDALRKFKAGMLALRAEDDVQRIRNRIVVRASE